MRYRSVIEAAEALHLSVPTIKRYIYDGKLHSTKLPGGQHRIAESEIQRLLTDSAGGQSAEEDGSPQERIEVLERWVAELEAEIERLNAALQVVSHYCASHVGDGGPDLTAAPLRHVAVLGPGCRRCDALYELTTRVLRATGRPDVIVERVHSLEDIAAYGPVVTPALVIDNKIVLSARVPTEAALKALLAKHLE